MAAGDTQITIVGNLVDDPELRFTPNGQAVARFRVASTPRFRDQQSGEWSCGLLLNALGPAEAEIFEMIGQAAVKNGDTLGLACRAAGEQDVAAVFRLDKPIQVVGRLAVHLALRAGAVSCNPYFHFRE